MERKKPDEHWIDRLTAVDNLISETNTLLQRLTTIITDTQKQQAEKLNKIIDLLEKPPPPPPPVPVYMGRKVREPPEWARPPKPEEPVRPKPFMSEDRDKNVTVKARKTEILFSDVGVGEIYYSIIHAESPYLGVSLDLDAAHVSFDKIGTLQIWEVDAPQVQGWWYARFSNTTDPHYTVVLTPAFPYPYLSSYALRLINPTDADILVTDVYVLRKIIERRD